MQILVYAHAQACPDPLMGGHLMFQNVCNKILVTEPKHYYLVLSGFGAIQYNFPGGCTPPSTYEGLKYSKCVFVPSFCYFIPLITIVYQNYFQNVYQTLKKEQSKRQRFFTNFGLSSSSSALF